MVLRLLKNVCAQNPSFPIPMARQVLLLHVSVPMVSEIKDNWKYNLYYFVLNTMVTTGIDIK